MQSFTRDIIFIGAVILVCTWWFLTAKNNTIKKYIVIQGLLWIIVVVVYIVMKLYSLPMLSFLSLFALIGAIVFYIKTILLKRRLEKSGNDPDKNSK